MNKSHRANMHNCLVHIRCSGAVASQALRDNPQEDTQHHVQHCPLVGFRISHQFAERCVAGDVFELPE
jgi:hypothetical protein